MTRQVTERDFRMPEFRDAETVDYEFRGDGKIVRKDRWESGMRRIACDVGMPMHGDVEISDVVSEVWRIFEVAAMVERAAADSIWREIGPESLA